MLFVMTLVLAEARETKDESRIDFVTICILCIISLVLDCQCSLLCLFDSVWILQSLLWFDSASDQTP